MANLVVFDIGGVLVRILHTWDDVLNALGEAPLNRTSPWRQAEYRPLSDYQDSSMDEDAYLAQLGSDLGLTAERARDAHNTMLIEDYSGALELVKDLQKAGVYTACLSNTNDLHWKKLASPAYHPAVASLDRRFASFEIRVNKPLPGAFEAVLEGFPDIERKFFFDDLAENVAAAAELGWETLRIDPDGDPPSQMRAFLVQSGIL